MTQREDIFYVKDFFLKITGALHLDSKTYEKNITYVRIKRIEQTLTSHDTMLHALERIAQEREDNTEVPQYIYDAINQAKGNT